MLENHMENLSEYINLLSRKAGECELLANLANDPDVRKKADRLAKDYRLMIDEAYGRMNFGRYTSGDRTSHSIKRSGN